VKAFEKNSWCARGSELALAGLKKLPAPKKADDKKEGRLQQAADDGEDRIEFGREAS